MSKNGPRATAAMIIIALAAAVGCGRRNRSDAGNGHGRPDSSAGLSSARIVSTIYADKDVVTLRVPVSSTSSHNSALVIGDKYGFYRARGIKLKYVTLPPSSGPAIDALRRGDIDLFTGGTGHPDGFIDALLAGLKVKAVVALTKGHPNFPHDTAWVLKDSPIKEPKDVIGKKVGGLTTQGWTQGCVAFYWSQYFKKFNIAPDQVTNALVPPQQQEQALQQGLIDIITVDPPRAAAIEASGKYRQLWSSWDITNGDVIDKQDADISVHGFAEDFIKKNPDVVKRYVRATIQALAFTVDNHEHYIDWVQKRAGALATAHDNGNHQNWSTGLVRPRALQKWIDWKVDVGQLQQGQVQPSDLYTNEFNPYTVYAMNDAVKNPTYWDNLPKEFLYLPIRK